MWQTIAIGAIVIIIVGYAVAILYPVFYTPSEADRIRKAQQEALKRHARAMKRDRERIAEYWRERGQVIKPLDATRYSAWFDETKEMS